MQDQQTEKKKKKSLKLEYSLKYLESTYLKKIFL